jgi:hypothetical protein
MTKAQKTKKTWASLNMSMGSIPAPTKHAAPIKRTTSSVMFSHRRHIINANVLIEDANETKANSMMIPYEPRASSLIN